MKTIARVSIIAFFFFGTISGVWANTDNEVALNLFETFASGYKSLNIPEFQMSYQANFENIPNLDRLRIQEKFFQKMRRRLSRIKPNGLSNEVQTQISSLKFEVEFNLARVHLEKRFKSGLEPAMLSNNGLHSLPDFREWYRLYVMRWGSKKLSPAQLVELGQSEVRRVTSEIRTIQRQLGFEGRDSDFYKHLSEPSFTVTDEAELNNSLQKVRNTIQENLGADFEEPNIAPVEIQPVANPNKNTPPGYFDKGVFYFTFFNKQFPRRSMEWLFMHEAVPGHYYQTEIAKTAKKTPLSGLFWYPGFSEGWGAYAEDLGKDLECYTDPYQYLGKWEWDLVRSARVVVDAGIHYLGWGRRKALHWWKMNVPNHEDIAEREIDRIIRWPAQAISYKVGEQTILKLRKNMRERQGNAFDLRRFHTLILQQGSIPLDVLEEIVRPQ